MRSKGKDSTSITSTAGINETKAHLKIEFLSLDREKRSTHAF